MTARRANQVREKCLNRAAAQAFLRQAPEPLLCDVLGPPIPSVAFEHLGARVDSPGVRNDPLAVLSLQERSSDLTRPDDEVPQAIKLLNDDVHLSLP